MTGLDYVTRVLEILGVHSPGQTVGDRNANIVFPLLNAMLDSWSNELGPVYAETQEAFNLTAAVSEYTLGPTGGFVTTRPNSFLRAKVRDVQDIDHNLTLMPNKEYQDYILKTPGDSLPWVMGINMNFPDIELFIYPPPDTNYSLRLTTYKSLSQATLASEYSVPVGYDNAIIWNLCVLAAHPFGKKDELGSVHNPTSISGLASRYYKEISIANIELEGIDSDPMLPDGDYTIRSWKTDN